MKKYNVEAIVLKNVNYKDSHKIYTLLTKEAGKITAVARGVRKISSRRAGNLDSLNRITANISQATNGYFSIEEAKSVESFSEMKQDLNLLLAGLYFADLVNVFLDESHNNPEIYKLLRSSLNVLNKNPQNLWAITSVFEFRMLNVLGLGMTVENCAMCGRRLDTSWEKILVDFDHGGFVCPRCSKVGLNINKRAALLLQLIKLEKNLSHLFDFTDSEISQAKKVINIHMSRMVETYARYPKLNAFLTDAISFKA